MLQIKKRKFNMILTNNHSRGSKTLHFPLLQKTTLLSLKITKIILVVDIMGNLLPWIKELNLGVRIGV